MSPGRMMRILLIVGAAACFVVGIVRVCELVAYRMVLDWVDLLAIVLPFVPIFLAAPQSVMPKRKFLFGTTAALELIVIASYFCLKPR